MAEFKDLNGKTWTLAFDGPKIHEIRQTVKDASGKPVDPQTPEFFLALEDDALIIIDTCYILCKDQLGAITPQQFYAALIGEATESAARALEKALLDFFRPRKRALLTALLERAEQVRELRFQSAEGLIPKIDAQIEELRKKLMSSDSATSGQESAESGPTDSPSENSVG